LAHAVATLWWLGVAWFLWSGHTDPLLIGLGAASCVVVLWLIWRLDVIDESGGPLRLGHRPLLYIPWLLWQIAVANVHVARVILDPRLPIKPQMLRLKGSQRTDLGRVIYGNSITLTPGTVALDVREERILVHALTEASAQGLLGGEMDRRVAQLERGSEPAG